MRVCEREDSVWEGQTLQIDLAEGFGSIWYSHVYYSAYLGGGPGIIFIYLFTLARHIFTMFLHGPESCQMTNREQVPNAPLAQQLLSHPSWLWAASLLGSKSSLCSTPRILVTLCLSFEPVALIAHLQQQGSQSHTHSNCRAQALQANRGQLRKNATLLNPCTTFSSPQMHTPS